MPSLTPRPAATITLLRDSARGPEVLMLKRNLNSAFVPGALVFPGGTVDEDDHAASVQGLCDGPDDAAASRTLRIERGGLAYWVAAIRELYEEAGVLLARDAAGALLDLTGAAEAERLRVHRKKIESGQSSLAAVIETERLRLAADSLTYFGHWITPEGAVRRYDARFFAAPAPESQPVEHDNREAIAHEWTRPAELLDRYKSGERALRTPTRHTLTRFADFGSVATLIAALQEQGDVSSIQPRITQEGRFVIPGEPGYEEAADRPGDYSKART